MFDRKAIQNHKFSWWFRELSVPNEPSVQPSRTYVSKMIIIYLHNLQFQKKKWISLQKFWSLLRELMKSSYKTQNYFLEISFPCQSFLRKKKLCIWCNFPQVQNWTTFAAKYIFWDGGQYFLHVPWLIFSIIKY